MRLLERVEHERLERLARSRTPRNVGALVTNRFAAASSIIDCAKAGIASTPGPGSPSTNERVSMPVGVKPFADVPRGEPITNGPSNARWVGGSRGRRAWNDQIRSPGSPPSEALKVSFSVSSGEWAGVATSRIGSVTWPGSSVTTQDVPAAHGECQGPGDRRRVRPLR